MSAVVQLKGPRVDLGAKAALLSHSSAKVKMIRKTEEGPRRSRKTMHKTPCQLPLHLTLIFSPHLMVDTE